MCFNQSEQRDTDNAAFDQLYWKLKACDLDKNPSTIRVQNIEFARADMAALGYPISLVEVDPGSGVCREVYKGLRRNPTPP